MSENKLTPLGEKIFLDRYSLKDQKKENLKPGMTVLLRVDGQTEVGKLLEDFGTGWDIQISDGTIVARHTDEFDVPMETVDQTYRRVANAVATHTEWAYEGDDLISVMSVELADKFYEQMASHKFTPAGRILAGMGNELGALTSSNCFVLPCPKDSRRGIFNTLADMADLMASGGGVGINVSSLRPQSSLVAGVNGRSSGSVSWGELYSFVCGRIEQGGCFTGDTRILTDKGNIPIKEVIERIELGEKFAAWTPHGYQAITDTFRNGVKPVYKVTTDSGYSVSLTEDHKMMTIDSKGEFRLISLKDIGEEKIIISLANTVTKDYQRLPENKNIHDSQGNEYPYINFPKELDEKFAFILGYYMANGCAIVPTEDGSHHLSFSVPNNRPELQKRIEEDLLYIFDKQIGNYPGDGQCRNYKVASRPLLKWWLNDCGFSKKSGAFVPEIVFRSPDSVIKAFYGGWFAADGCNRGTKSGLGIDCVDKNALLDLQKLLAQLGIPSKIHCQPRGNKLGEHNWKNLYRLNTTGIYASDLVSWLGEYTSKVLDKELSCRSGHYVWPCQWARILELPHRSGIKSKLNKISDCSGGTFSATAVHELVKHASKCSFVTQKAIENIKNSAPESIKSIDYLGEEETFDITVAEQHVYSANGLTVSNSRRGALMLMLACWHPDVEEFITHKQDPLRTKNANISVQVTDNFMHAVKNNLPWTLGFPETSFSKYDSEWDGDLEKWMGKGYPVKSYKTISARELFRSIADSAWKSAEPGVWFIDQANRLTPLARGKDGKPEKLVATNPCAEQSLPPYGVCLLGHINLSKFVKKNAWEVIGDHSIFFSQVERARLNTNWDELKKSVEYAVEFLNLVIDNSNYPLPRIKEQQERDRRMGLGTLGLGDMLIRLGLRYGSPEAVVFADKLYSFIKETAYEKSRELKQEGYGGAGTAHLDRANITLITQAPTGTTGTALNTSTGIEPYFALEWTRKGRLGMHKELCPVVTEYQDYINKVHVANGEQKEVVNLPEYFVTAYELTVDEHLAMMEVIQKHTDSSISKTVNMPASATVEDVEKLYQEAYSKGLKGISIYRDGSRDEQVLYVAEPASKPVEESGAEPLVGTSADEVYDAEFPDSEEYEGEYGERESYKSAYHRLDIPDVRINSSIEYTDTGVKFPWGGALGKKDSLTEAETTPKGRQKVRESVTLERKTAGGTLHTTLTINNAGDYVDVFFQVGKSGSDVTAFTEAVGRLISLYLRTSSDSELALLEIIGQLEGIGGTASGMGPNSSLSIPDAISKTLSDGRNWFVDRKNNPATLVTPVVMNPVENGKIVPGITPTLTPKPETRLEAELDKPKEVVHNEPIKFSQPKALAFGRAEPKFQLCISCGGFGVAREANCENCRLCGASKCG